MEPSSLTVTPLSLPGVLLITPSLNADNRGFFGEIYTKEVFAAHGIMDTFVQDSVSYSGKNVIRGLHYQREPHAQAKLVRCSSGEIFDVAADVDPASPTFGKFASARLTGEVQNMLYIPPKYAHGFCVVSEGAVVEYKLSAEHHPESSGGALYNDPVFSIPWPVTDPVLSEKDRAWARITDSETHAR